MRGPKLNEGATYAQHQTGERHGTKATAKYIHSSAYKARVVLDLVRGLPVYRADEVLRFTDRAIAKDIRKVLASAVANASDTENAAYLGSPDELFVLACFADEGATMRRFRPRARGRATRIRKRSCHITVVVARMSEGRLEIERNRAEGQQANSAASRRARVERSRARTNEDDTATDDTTDDAKSSGRKKADKKADAATDTSTDTSTDTATDTASDADDTASDADTNADAAADSSVKAFADTGADDGATDAADDSSSVSGELTPAEWHGSVVATGDGKTAPEGYPIKGNADSMLYHTPDSRYYKVTKAEVWFDTEENAEAAGFSKPGAAASDESDKD